MSLIAPSARTTAASRTSVLLLMCVGMFLVQLDVTVVNAALPAIASGLDAGLLGQQWVVDGYAVVLASLLLIAGACGDRYGHRRLVLAGLVLFGAASLAGGLAPSVGALIVARAVQGAGAALLLPATLAVITQAFPGRGEQARAVGVWAGVSALALPAGPLLGGALVSGFGWRAVFLVNLPIVALAVPATLRLVSESAACHARRPDVAGATLLALTLGAGVYCVIAAGHGNAVQACGACGLAVLSGAGFVLAERRAAAPILPLPLLRTPGVVGPNVVAAAMNLVGIGTVFVATLYLQTVLDHDALLAGILLLPLFVPLAAFAPVAGRLTARYGPRPLMCTGLLLGALGSGALIGVDAADGYPRLLPSLLALGVGMGVLTAAVVAAAVSAVPAEHAGMASALNNTARQAAGALGIACYGAIVGSPHDVGSFVDGLHAIGLGAAVLWLAGIVLTLRTVPRGRRR